MRSAIAGWLHRASSSSVGRSGMSVCNCASSAFTVMTGSGNVRVWSPQIKTCSMSDTRANMRSRRSGLTNSPLLNLNCRPTRPWNVKYPPSSMLNKSPVRYHTLPASSVTSTSAVRSGSLRYPVMTWLPCTHNSPMPLPLPL